MLSRRVIYKKIRHSIKTEDQEIGRRGDKFRRNFGMQNAEDRLKKK